MIDEWIIDKFLFVSISEELAKSLGPNAFAAGKVDVTSEELVKNAIEKTVQKFGKIAGVVSNPFFLI